MGHSRWPSSVSDGAVRGLADAEAAAAIPTRWALRGIASGSGAVRGPARLLARPEDWATVETGDVLVVRDAGLRWTRALARAACLVTDTGGALSSLSTVARELGIPAVTGSGTATQVISSGQIISVDGGQGVVAYDGPLTG